jgi:CRP/FNR family transcriptional regulator, cyclic AMP receptor protein
MQDKRSVASYLESSSRPLSTQNLADRLQYDEFFSLFPPQIRNDIFSKAITKNYKAGETVYFRGDTESFMGVVMQGRLRMSMTATDGRGVLIGLVECGEVFGETTLLDGLPRTTTAEADTETRLMIIKRENFIPALQSQPEAMLGVIKMLCHRLRIYLDTIDMIALRNLTRRLARHLLRLASEYGVEEKGHIIIRAGLNQTALGQQLAASRESINKQLKDFAAQNLISAKGNEIVLIDIEGLEHIAG